MNSELQAKNNAKNGNPLVSIILPIYNGTKYLREAIDSILSQSYTNLEAIIINDGSTDDSAAIVKKINDPRIRYFEQENQGLAATLNRAIGLAQGKYIARQDQDDISLPLRFERQIEFLEAHPHCGMVGTWAEIWVDDVRSERAHRHPQDNASLQFFLLFNNPFVHSSMMIRKAVFDRVGLYSTDKDRQPPEDYELWSRVARAFEVANIPEILHVYRETSGSMSRDGLNPFLEKVVNISAENLAWVTGRNCADTAIRDLAALFHGAAHLVSPRPRFDELSDLLQGAAEGVCRQTGVEKCPVEEDAKVRLKSIHHHYLLHRFGSVFGRILTVFDALFCTRKR